MHREGEQAHLSPRDHAFRHGRVVRAATDDLRGRLDAKLIVLVEDLMDSKIGVRLDGPQDLHMFAPDRLDREANLADHARPFAPDEIREYGYDEADRAKRWRLRTEKITRLMQGLTDQVAPVDFPHVIKVHLRTSGMLDVMENMKTMARMDPFPGIRPTVDLAFQMTPGAAGLVKGWSMDAPPWEHPAMGGSPSAEAECTRATADFARRRRAKETLTGEDVVAFLEFHLSDHPANTNKMELSLNLLYNFGRMLMRDH